MHELHFEIVFGIIYQIVEKQIVVIAVMHLHKKPDYWKKRGK
jgi:hypothetical protein